MPARASGFTTLLFAPMVWAAHFLGSYVTAAIDCADQADGGLIESRALIGAYTLIALLLIGIHAARSFAAYRASGADRARFIGYTGFLLALISAIATVFVALPLLLSASCR